MWVVLRYQFGVVEEEEVVKEGGEEVGEEVDQEVELVQEEKSERKLPGVAQD